ncbi:hypothetical protein ACSLBF_09860 [Pseudoalteromonas sp. T1lg65]|uniref:hypothetical protein n=1 Tax=Pseudoalteromonas sp. T1lg65 TaxID=2077101 RepID=UPI003F79280B
MKLQLKKSKIKNLSNQKRLENDATPEVGGGFRTYRCSGRCLTNLTKTANPYGPCEC